MLTSDEAGAFGFHLLRRLEELGIKNYMRQPQDWDDWSKGLKNDWLDAAASCQRLDRDERGNRKAFSAVRVPPVGDERQRAIRRQRQQLMRERQRVAGMGRGLLALTNIHITGKWWKGKAWAAIKVLAPACVIELLDVSIKILTALEELELRLMHHLQEAAGERKILRAVGPLTFVILRRQIRDWGRFNNRRQVSSYTGIVPERAE